MEHFFSLPVLYKGEELSLNGRLVTFAYSYKYYIVINNREIIFERDDEHNFRVIDEAGDGGDIDAALLQAIVASLKQM